MKVIKFYEEKLKTVVPKELLPILPNNATIQEQQTYVYLLREIYCALTYQIGLNNELITEKISLLYKKNNIKLI